MNSLIKVSLTDYGKQVLIENLENTLPPDMIAAAYEQYQTGYFQLWDLMSIFGKHLYCGNNNTPFGNNEIEAGQQCSR
jgi:hypothetical protein